MAPTRIQVDNAHARGRYLDIGVPSLRNFTSIPWSKRAIWLILSISSLPLHLIYNSIIVTSSDINDSSIQAYTELDLAARKVPKAEEGELFYGYDMEHLANLTYDAIDSGILLNITIEDLMGSSSAPWKTSGSSLIFVMDDSEANNRSSWPLEMIQTFAETGSLEWRAPWEWICHIDVTYGTVDCQQDLRNIVKNGTRWENPLVSSIRQIYVQPTRGRCKLLFSLQLCWIVTCLNLVKGVLMLHVAFASSHDPLLTIGDAVASFLQTEDAYTSSMSLKGAHDFKNSFWMNLGPGPKTLGCPEPVLRFGRPIWDTTPRHFTPTPVRRFDSASLARWSSTMVLCLVTIGAGVFLLFYGLFKNSGQADIIGWGLGNARTEALIGLTQGAGSMSLLASALLANTPQLVLSLCYVAYNAIFTSICAATEWSSYGVERKGLRVTSKPVEAQRETYFLQLPFRFSIPLTGFSISLHWLISQSIFVIAVENFTMDSSNVFILESTQYLAQATCGWSPLGIILSVAVGSAMMGFIVLCSWAHLPCPGMPVVRSCSAAIAAACHLDPYEPLAWERPLMWGALPQESATIRHCSFSSEAVEIPTPGVLYD